MSTQNGYAREKLYQALRSLLTDRSIQDRLAGASTYLLRLKASDFPKEQAEEFEAIMNELSKQPTSDEGAKLADRILSLYIQLRGGI